MLDYLRWLKQVTVAVVIYHESFLHPEYLETV